MTDSTAPEASTPPRKLFWFSILTAAYTLIHIKYGALVVSTGSGMAFPDWPLANGSWWPEGMTMPGYYEHIHRFLGAGVGLLSIILLVRIRRLPTAVPHRTTLVKVAWWILGLVIVQGVLGGLGVIFSPDGVRTKAAFAIAHGVLAQTLLCLLVGVSFALSRSWNQRVEVGSKQAGTARRMSLIAVTAVFCQLVVGAIYRHTDLGAALWVHISMAMLVAVLILAASAMSVGRIPAAPAGMRRLSRWIHTLLVLQLVLGFVTLAVRRFKDPSNIEDVWASFLPSLHVVTGALLYLCAALLAVRAFRTLMPASGSQTAEQPSVTPAEGAA